MGDSSGTGVCFTRDPNNGENTLFGEFLINAQGEDVVAGIRTPKPISELDDAMPGKMWHEIYRKEMMLHHVVLVHFGTYLLHYCSALTLPLFQTSMPSSSQTLTFSRSTTETCKMSNSPSKRANSTCSKPVQASVEAKPP